jgi:Glycosyl transferase family 2
MMDNPVSILICFYERPFFLPLITQNLLSQTYVKKKPEKVEIIIADDSVEEYRLNDVLLRENLKKESVNNFLYLRMTEKLTIGQKRNLLCSKASNELMIFMDDDDFYFPTYVEYSLEQLFRKRKCLVGSNSMLFTYVNRDFKKLSINCVSPRQIHEATLCMTKSHWKTTGGFADKGNGEGANLIDGHEAKVNAKLDITKMMVCLCHERNTCQKDMFIDLGSPAEFPFSQETKNMILSCLSDPLYLKRVKICFKYPTRSRPDVFKSQMTKYLDLLSWEHEYQFVISMDTNDETMNNDEMKRFLNGLRKRVQVEYYYGDSKNKIDACNRDMVAPCADILVLVSDDMVPQIQDFDKLIVEDMKKSFPDYDGMLNYNDGFKPDWPNLCTLTIYGMKYYRRFNYIYHPEYISLFADNEQTIVGRILNRIKDIDTVIIKHEWNAINDDLRKQTESRELYNKDFETFNKRKSMNFGLNKFDSLLTIMMVTHDYNSIPHSFNNLPNSMKTCQELMYQSHFSQSLVYSMDYLTKLCSTVKTPFVTFHFPNEKFKDDYKDTILNALKENMDKDLITFQQVCSLDQGRTVFTVETDVDRDSDENIPVKGPWQSKYIKKMTNWNIYRTCNINQKPEKILKIDKCIYEFTT